MMHNQVTSTVSCMPVLTCCVLPSCCPPPQTQTSYYEEKYYKEPKYDYDYYSRYSYDKYGNISKLETTFTQPTGSAINILTTTTDYSYDASNRLTKMRYSEGEAEYSVNTSTYLTYDMEGNLTEKSKWNESKMYGGSKGETDYYNYNGFNQLAEFEKDTGLAQNETYYYYYNAQGLGQRR
jgi:hypothetical protein